MPRLGRLADWLAARFPYREIVRNALRGYDAPRNFNFWYVFGALAMLVFAIQVVSGLLLLVHYQANKEEAFASIQTIMYDVHWGWLVRYLHTTGASMFFIVIYLHMVRGLLYGSFRKPRELLWLVGFVIYLMLMVESDLGYLLPFGNMSYWGGEVITSIIEAVPFIGDWLVSLVRGGPGIATATLNRFMAFHGVLMPLLLLALVAVHVIALHRVGSNNPDGIEITRHRDRQGRPLDAVPFHPYYTVKDLFAAALFLVIFLTIIFYAPTMNGLFIEPNNYLPANPLKTPADITPAWYLSPYYAMLRSIPNKLGGIGVLALAMLLPLFLPWLDRNPVRSSRYRPRFFIMLMLLFAAFVGLGWIGLQPASPALVWPGRILLAIYLLFFLALPIAGGREPTRLVPERVGQ